MNDSLYEQYMRSVLGYEPMDNRNTYDMNYGNYTMNSNMMGFSNMQNEELESCYPDIYRLVYPMVQKACMQNTRPMTRELIDNMTDEIYFAIDDNEITGMRGKDDKEVKTPETRSEDRQRVFRNPTLRDLIRILILREILGRPGFPGRPPRPPMRPPMRPRPRPGMGPFNRQSYDSFDDNYNIYEY